MYTETRNRSPIRAPKFGKIPTVNKGPLRRMVQEVPKAARVPRAAPYAPRPKQVRSDPRKGYVRVRGLPFSATPEDVVETFCDFEVTSRDVFMGMCTSGPHNGQPDGQAFVQLPAARVTECVEQLDGASIGSRYLEIFPTDESDFNRTRKEGKLRAVPGWVCTQVIVAAPMAGRRGSRSIGAPRVAHYAGYGSSVLRIRGLPFTVSAQDVASVFEEYMVTKSDVYLGLVVSGPRTGAPDGQAYVRFQTQELSASAGKQCQRKMVGDRYIELFEASEEELAQKLDNGGAQSCEFEGEFENEDSEAGWLRFRGLRFQATKLDVIEFCAAHYDLRDDDVVMKLTADGRPSGECFVRLDSEETACEMHRSLDSKVIDGRYIEVFRSSFSDAARNARMSMKCRAMNTSGTRPAVPKRTSMREKAEF